MNTNYITLTLFSIAPWHDEEIKSLILLLDSQTIFRPDKWGPYEPLKFEFSQSELASIQARWKSRVGLGFLLGKSNYGFSITVNKNLRFKKPNRISVFLNEDFFINGQQTQAFLDFAKQLFEWGEIVYGYACHRSDFERKNILPVPTRIEGKLISTGGSDIRRCLPGIYWANFFSGQYVKWFGENKFRNLHSYTKQDLPKNGKLALSSGSPLDYGQSTVVKRESSMRKQLGQSVFFDIHHPTRVTDSPFKDGPICIE